MKVTLKHMDISDNQPTACSTTTLPTDMLSGLRWDNDTMKIPLCKGQKKAMKHCKVCYKKKKSVRVATPVTNARPNPDCALIIVFGCIIQKRNTGNKP